MLDAMRVDPYEERLLRAVGHPNPSVGIRELLHHAATEPAVRAARSSKLEEAAQVIMKVQSDITIVTKQQTQPPGGSTAPAGITAEKLRRRKRFSRPGKVFSGMVMLTAMGCLFPPCRLAQSPLSRCWPRWPAGSPRWGRV